MGPGVLQPYRVCPAILLWRLPCVFLPSMSPLSDSLLTTDLAERFIEEADAFVHVGFGDIHGRSHADGVAVEAAFADEEAVGAGTFHDLICLLRGGLFCLTVFHKFEGLHHAHTANVADERIFLLQLFEFFPEVAAHHMRILEKIFFFDYLADGAGCNRRDRVAAERGDIQALKFSCEFGGGDRETDRHAVGHAFGGGDDIRRNFPLFDAPPFFAGAAPAGLHFVGDKKAAVVFHDAVNDFEIFRRWSDESADALNRFGDERSDRAAGGGLNYPFHIVRAGHAAFGIFQMQRAAIAIGIHGMRDADADDSCFAPS